MLRRPMRPFPGSVEPRPALLRQLDWIASHADSGSVPAMMTSGLKLGIRRTPCGVCATVLLLSAGITSAEGPSLGTVTLEDAGQPRRFEIVLDVLRGKSLNGVWRLRLSDLQPKYCA